MPPARRRLGVGVDRRLAASAVPVQLLEEAFEAATPDLETIIATANKLFRQRIESRFDHIRVLVLLARALLARNHTNDAQEAEDCLSIAMGQAAAMRVPALIISVASQLALVYLRNRKQALADDLVRQMLQDYPSCADNATFHASRCAVEGISDVAA